MYYFDEFVMGRAFPPLPADVGMKRDPYSGVKLARTFQQTFALELAIVALRA
jgi:hypothetical protein